MVVLLMMEEEVLGAPIVPWMDLRFIEGERRKPVNELEGAMIEGERECV